MTLQALELLNNPAARTNPQHFIAAANAADQDTANYIKEAKSIHKETTKTNVKRFRPYPALFPFYFTSNQFPPDDPAFQRRIFPTYYSHDDIPVKKEV
jgi:hypothetical protein